MGWASIALKLRLAPALWLNYDGIGAKCELPPAQSQQVRQDGGSTFRDGVVRLLTLFLARERVEGRLLVFSRKRREGR
jgi:hypothetical protein